MSTQIGMSPSYVGDSVAVLDLMGLVCILEIAGTDGRLDLRGHDVERRPGSHRRFAGLLGRYVPMVWSICESWQSG